jgi:hypothetical protein
VETPTIGDLVRVTDGSRALDGIVFDTPSRLKVVVAVVAPGRGPGFRTVHPETLTERGEESADDQALRSLIRRTQPAARGNGRGGQSVGKGAAGFTRGANHRSTGR